MFVGRSGAVLAGFGLNGLPGGGTRHRCLRCDLEAEENLTWLERSQAWDLCPLRFAFEAV